MHFKLNNIILIQNDTTMITKIFKNQMYYLKSTSKQQALINQNDLILLITTPTVTTPTGLARQSKNNDIKFKKNKRIFQMTRPNEACKARPPVKNNTDCKPHQQKH